MHHFFVLFCQPPADRQGFEPRKTERLEHVCRVNWPNFTVPCWQGGKWKKQTKPKHTFMNSKQDLWEVLDGCWYVEGPQKIRMEIEPTSHWNSAGRLQVFLFFLPQCSSTIFCLKPSLARSLSLCLTQTHTLQDMTKLVESQDSSHLFVCKIPTHAAAVSHRASKDPQEIWTFSPSLNSSGTPPLTRFIMHGCKCFSFFFVLLFHSVKSCNQAPRLKQRSREKRGNFTLAYGFIWH